MAKVYDSVYACFKRPEFSEEKKTAAAENEANEAKTPPKNVSEASTDPQQSLLKRASGGLVSATTGVIGAGIGTVKWAASATYGVGSVVVGKIRRTDNSKDKKD